MTSISTKYSRGVEEEIQRIKNSLNKRKRTRKLVSYFSYPTARIRKDLFCSVQSRLQLEEDQFNDFRLEVPPPHIQADFAISVFAFASMLKKDPSIIAKEAAHSIKKHNLKFIEKVSNTGGYVNITLDKKAFYADVLEATNKLNDLYGESDVNAHRIALIDYSSPNIAKPIGIGHLRSTIIGQALGNIYKVTGFDIVRINHLGDWGTQFGSLLYAYQKWGDEKKVKENPIEELRNLYSEFNQEADKNPVLREEARKVFRQLESGDEYLIQLWNKFRELSISEFEKTYKKLGASFDLYLGESYFVQKVDKLVESILEKDIAKEENKVVVVEQLNNLPSFLLRKSDGSSLYLTRDLASLKFRVDTFNPDMILYVVGSEQDLHFKQLLALARKAGILKEETLAKHISFGLMLKEGKKISTRKGTSIRLENVLEESISKSREILKEKNPDLDEKTREEVANVIGIGAIIYNDLRQSRVGNIEFNWERVLNLKTGSAVYLQYTYARIQSIFRKCKSDLPALNKTSLDFLMPVEFELARKVSLFPEVVRQAQRNDETHSICTYLEELATLFNSFYSEVPILQAENEQLVKSRLYLINTVAITIRNGLRLLNISVPSKM